MEKVQKGILRLLPVFIEEQLADFLTKHLPPPKFSSFISKLGMINIYHAPACGRILKHNTKDLGLFKKKKKDLESRLLLDK